MGVRASSTGCSLAIESSLRDKIWHSGPTLAALPDRTRRRPEGRSVLVSEYGEGVGQIVRIVRSEGHLVTGPRMDEAQSYRVQPLAGQAEPGGQGRIGAVGEIADARVVYGAHVHPDLVRTPGLQVDLQQAGEPMRLERLVVGDARPSGCGDGPLVVVLGMPADRRVDRARQRVGMTLDEGVVDLVDPAIPERLLETGVGPLGLGHDHESAGADVEPVHDALPLGRSRG